MATAIRFRAVYPDTDEIVTKLVIIDCPNCALIYGVTAEFERRRRGDGRTFYGPCGHGASYAESEADRLRKQLDEEEQRRSDAEERAELEKRAHAATKSKLTKTLNRVNAGVCPHCNRTFQNVSRHMQSKHFQGNGHPEPWKEGSESTKQA